MSQKNKDLYEYILEEILSEHLIEYNLETLPELYITKLVDLLDLNGYTVTRPITGNRKRISISWKKILLKNKNR